MAGICLPLGLCKETVTDLYKAVDILTSHMSTESIVTEANPTNM